MTPQTLRDVLYRHNILIANEDFVTLIAEMDADGDVTRNAAMSCPFSPAPRPRPFGRLRPSGPSPTRFWKSVCPRFNNG